MTKIITTAAAGQFQLGLIGAVISVVWAKACMGFSSGFSRIPCTVHALFTSSGLPAAPSATLAIPGATGILSYRPASRGPCFPHRSLPRVHKHPASVRPNGASAQGPASLRSWQSRVEIKLLASVGLRSDNGLLLTQS